MRNDAPLVVVTRPHGQADGLVIALRAAGAEVLQCPVINIEPLVPRTPPPDIDWLVFVSRNAVLHGMAALGDLPRRATVAAVGSGTARALAEAGVDGVVLPAEGAALGAAGLLAHPRMQSLRNARVLIVRGVGGREALAEGLRERGARVNYMEAYRRATASGGGETLRRLYEEGREPVIVVTSGEGVRNLFQMAGADLADWLRELPYAAIAPRVAHALLSRGVRTAPVVARDTGDRAMARAALRAAPARIAEDAGP